MCHYNFCLSHDDCYGGLGVHVPGIQIVGDGMNWIYFLLLLTFTSLCSIVSIAFIDNGKRHNKHHRVLFGIFAGVLSLFLIALILALVILHPEYANRI